MDCLKHFHVENITLQIIIDEVHSIFFLIFILIGFLIAINLPGCFHIYILLSPADVYKETKGEDYSGFNVRV